MPATKPTLTQPAITLGPKPHLKASGDGYMLSTLVLMSTTRTLVTVEHPADWSSEDIKRHATQQIDQAHVFWFANDTCVGVDSVARDMIDRRATESEIFPLIDLSGTT